MTPNAFRYPLDSTGANPDNLVINEVHDIGTRNIRILAPSNGAYYTDSIVVYDDSTDTPLKKDVDFRCVELLQEASMKFGKEICIMVVVLNKDISSKVRVTYQVVGGHYQYDGSIALGLYEAALKDARQVNWLDVIGKPLEYPPAFHKHMLEDVQGFGAIVVALERVRSAILLGDVPAFEAITDWVNEKSKECCGKLDELLARLVAHIEDYNDPHKTTKAHVGLGQIEDLPVTTPVQAAVDTPTRAYVTYDILLEVLERKLDELVIPTEAPTEPPTEPPAPTSAYYKWTVTPQITPLAEGETFTFNINGVGVSPAYTWEIVPSGTVINEGTTVTFYVNSIPVADSGEGVPTEAPTEPPVLAPVIAKPVIATPLPADTNLQSTVTITSSAFALSSGTDTHKSSGWQLSKFRNFSTLIAAVPDTATDKTSWTVTGLQPNEQYYVRVRHKGVSGVVSAWSLPSGFKTATEFGGWIEVKKLYDTTSTSQDLFGSVLSLSDDGNTVAVGCPDADDGVSSGKIYIFTRTNGVWAAHTVLKSDSYVAGGKFGYSLCLSGDAMYCAVGAPGERGSSVGSGVVYIFRKDASGVWAKQRRIAISDGAGADKGTGKSVALNKTGTYCAIGSPDGWTVTSGGGATGGKGAVYVFKRTNAVWAQEDRLAATDGADLDRFGYAVSIDSAGANVAVGSPSHAMGGYARRGAVYIFSRASTLWTQTAVFTGTDGVNHPLLTDMQFGMSVRLSGNGVKCYVGAPLKKFENGATYTGATYSFVKNGSTWAQEMTASAATANSVLAESVGISSDGLVRIRSHRVATAKGSPRTEEYTITAGVSYLFGGGELTVGGAETGDLYGYSVAMAGNGRTVAISAPKDALNVDMQGSVYILDYFDRNKPAQPTITSPATGALGQPASVTFTSSPFTMEKGTDTHAYSDWELSAQANFSTVLASAYASAADKTTWTTGNLSVNTTYYARVRYIGAKGDYSAWSTAVSFKTAASFSSYQQQGKITEVSTPQAEYAALGAAVALSSDGKIAAIGAPYTDQRYVNLDGSETRYESAGAVYIFVVENGAWVKKQTIRNDVASNNKYFGWSVALSYAANVLLVGATNFALATGGSQGLGRAYVYEKTTADWGLVKTLSPTNTTVASGFGAGVAVSGDGSTLAVGAPSELTYKGTVYLYTKVNGDWTLQARCLGNGTTPVLSNNTKAGTCLALSGNGDVCVVGTHLVTTGVAYVLGRSSGVWNTAATVLSPTDPVTGAYSSAAVAVDHAGSTIAAASTTSANTDNSKVYLWKKAANGWVNEAEVDLPTPSANQSPGKFVKLSADGTVCAVGSTTTNGRVYLLEKTTTGWVLQNTLVADDGVDGDLYGHAVAMNGDATLLAIGAPWVTASGQTNTGAVYISTKPSLQYTANYSATLSNPTVGTNGLNKGDTAALVVAGTSTPVIGVVYWGIVHVTTEDSYFPCVHGMVSVSGSVNENISLQTNGAATFTGDREFRVALYSDAARTKQIGISDVLKLKGGMDFIDMLINGVDIHDPTTPFNGHTFYLSQRCGCSE